ncbi:MAG: hypothetical protein KDA92_16710 [Planctomycetales bacterium]|nr:hypothetical protein [Planctomycetales bacterium]MCA9167844.1 hypothetical protein [Planctomycetales bacterium]
MLARVDFWLQIRYVRRTVAASLSLVLAIAGSTAHAQLEFHYTFDTAAAPIVDVTGNHPALSVRSNGPEMLLGEPSLIGGDGNAIGLTSPGDTHPTGNYLLLQNAPESSSFTVSLWMQPLFTGQPEALFARDNVWWPSPCAFYCLYIDGQQGLTWKTGGEDAIVTDEQLIEEDELYHVVISYVDSDGPDTNLAERTRLFVNGELIDEIDEPQEIPSLAAASDANDIYQLFWVGTLSSFGGFSGWLDDLQFYTTELSAEQVAELYANPGSVISFPGGTGDFNDDGALDITDINLLTEESARGTNVSLYDLTDDGLVDHLDVEKWIDVKQTWIGDSNLDGIFDSADFVAVFAVGEYEDGIDGNSNWSDGDWNGDGDFDSSDFVAAFTSGGYEQGPRAAVSAVPEPCGVVLFVTGLTLAIWRRRK